MRLAFIRRLSEGGDGFTPRAPDAASGAALSAEGFTFTPRAPDAAVEVASPSARYAEAD